MRARHRDLTRALSSCHWCSSRHGEEPCSRACCSRSSCRRPRFPDSRIWASAVTALPRRASLRRAVRRSSSCRCRTLLTDLQGETAGAGSVLSASLSVVVNVRGQPDWAPGAWTASSVRLGVRLRAAGCPPSRGWASSRRWEACSEEKADVPRLRGSSSCLTPGAGTSVLPCPWP